MNEEQIQNSFVAWLERNCEYFESFSDPNGGAGAIFDSIGSINDVPVLIEFKCSITPSIIRYDANKPSSIERKIRNTLESLHCGSFLDGWEKNSIPRIWLVSEKISIESVEELNVLLRERSENWGFSYEFGTWSGKEYHSLGSGPSERIEISKLQNIDFSPAMPWPGDNRLPRRKIAEFQSIARQKGVADLFEHFLRLSDDVGLIVSCNRNNINLSAVDTESGKTIRVMGIWPADSNAQGLCVAADSERLDRCFPFRDNPGDQAPGTPTIDRGFLGSRSLLARTKDVNRYLAWATGPLVNA